MSLVHITEHKAANFVYIASARHNYSRPFLPKTRAVIWNLSKRADNASGLVQPELFELLFSLLSQDGEEGDVLRRVVSCIQNLASMRRSAVSRFDSVFCSTNVRMRALRRSLRMMFANKCGRSHFRQSKRTSSGQPSPLSPLEVVWFRRSRIVHFCYT